MPSSFDISFTLQKQHYSGRAIFDRTSIIVKIPNGTIPLWKQGERFPPADKKNDRCKLLWKVLIEAAKRDIVNSQHRAVIDGVELAKLFISLSSLRLQRLKPTDGASCAPVEGQGSDDQTYRDVHEEI